jgi:hypothetical protein
MVEAMTEAVREQGAAVLRHLRRHAADGERGKEHVVTKGSTGSPATSTRSRRARRT